MLSINKINLAENTYTNQNKKISFKSKFVPNKTLKDTFDIMTSKNAPLFETKTLANAMNAVLNDGKNDLVEIATNKNGKLFYKINGKKGKLANKGVCENLNIKILTKDEIKAIQNAINKLNADLNADDVTKNPEILINIDKNMAEIKKELRKHTTDLLINLKEQIFNKAK